MRLASSVAALGVVALLLFVLGVRFGHVAFVAGIGLALAGGLIGIDLPRGHSGGSTDERGAT